MGKDFLNLKISYNYKKISRVVFCIGIMGTSLLTVQAFNNTKLPNGNEVLKSEAGEGIFEQELIAVVGEEKIPLTLEVEERKITEKEAEEILLNAERALNGILKGSNENLENISREINFADNIPGTPVEVEWLEKLPEYFYSDGTLREDVEISEPTERKVSAILSIQDYTKDYEAVLKLAPRKRSLKQMLLEQVEEISGNSREEAVLKLPEIYQEMTIVWKRPLDFTFVWFGVLSFNAVIFLNIAGKRDMKVQKQERQERMEKDYAQIVSKFTMLLSAGLSVRNSWERIVWLSRGSSKENHPVYEEMSRAMRQMQQGVSELEVYEKFGTKVGSVYYKKLMSLFILEKKRGSTNLLEAMTQEMLQSLKEQKQMTRQRGEKTGAKLLLPMMGMLGVVFIMILVPAFLSFQL